MSDQISKQAGISRRTILKGAALLPLPFIARRAYASETLYINTWGGEWQKAANENFFQPFTEATGIKIETVSPVSIAKLAAQAKSGVYEFDITTLSGPQQVQVDVEGIVEPVDEAFMTTSESPEGYVFRNGIASHAFASVLTYNKEKLPTRPKGWVDFWDTEKFPGPRTFSKYPFEHILISLMGDGVPISELYPLDIERAYKSMDRLKPDVPVYWSAGSHAQQLLRDGEVAAAQMWHSTAVALMKEYPQFDISWEQQIIESAYWTVSKGTPRAAQAWEFIKFATAPERLAGFCQQAKYGPLNPRSFEYVGADAAKFMPTNPDLVKLGMYEDAEAIGPLVVDLTRRFEAWSQS